MTVEQASRNRFKGLRKRYKKELHEIEHFLDDISQDHLEDELTGNPILHF
jgi:hypothetical protein